MIPEDTDNDSIKYVYNEMEPTERLEFERRMDEDQNLLIEVETIKKTRSRLKSIPVLEPPQAVVQNILDQSAGNRSSGFSLSNALMAAVILFTVSAGYMTMSDDQRSGILGESGRADMPDDAAGATSAGFSQAQPWVDYNEVLYLDQTSGGKMVPDSMVSRVQPMLRPVTRNVQNSFLKSQVVLTGNTN